MVAQPTVHFIHGINVWNPEKDIGRLKPCFQEAGFKNVVVEDYGFLPFGFAWLRSRSIAEEMLPKIADGDILVAHSHGAVISGLMIEMGARPSGAVLLDPAMDRDKALPQGVDWVHVYYTPDDMVVWLSKWIPFHTWGDQGKVGFKGSDSRYTNFNTTELNAVPLSGHSGFWADEKFPAWCPLLGKATWDKHTAHEMNKKAVSQ